MRRIPSRFALRIALLLWGLGSKSMAQAPQDLSLPVYVYTDLGNTEFFVIQASGSSPLAYQWLKDGLVVANGLNAGGATLTGASSNFLTLTGVTGYDQGGYSCRVTNIFGSATSSAAGLTVYYPFPDASFNPGADGAVRVVNPLPDGKILVGGGFTTLGGQARNRIGRLNADGTLDTTFNPGASDYVFSTAVQPDGRLVLGGFFTTLGGQTRNYIGRLNADGTLDTGFNPGASSVVQAVALQSDGKILVGGRFTNLGGQSRNRIGRLNVDGALDTSFNPGTGADEIVFCMAVQADGKVLVGGDFITLGGQTRNYIGRLNADGSVDTSFNPAASRSISSIVVQPDGKILVVQVAYTSWGLRYGSRMDRLNADGTLDGSFSNPAANDSINAVALQADGKILVAGDFTSIGGQNRSRIARLNSDGTLDGTFFNPGADAAVQALALQPDGRILVGGGFFRLGTQIRQCIGQIPNIGSAIDDLHFNDSSITWLRGGTAPEVSRTTFEQTTNGTNWTFLGEGIRITGGWQLGQGATANSIIRGRGYVASDVGKGSGQIVETIVGLPTIVAQPLSCTNSAGTVATFTANAIGSAPLSCQWFKGATPLSDGGKTTGSATFALVLSNLLASDAGQYFVVITNTYGATTSCVANLAIIDPAILTQPTSQSAIFGGSATFTVTAAGTGMTYQWRRGGTPLTEATNAMLVLTNVSGALAGNYDVVICGSHGCVTSSVVSLTVTDPAIVSQPVSQTVLVGGNAAFTVGAVGTGIGYQWRRQGSLIAGATDASLSLTNVTAIAAGNYDVLVCGSYGCVTSSVASFTVLNPAIQPTSQSVGFGSNATFTVSVAGTGPISYQWRRQGTPLDGATNATLAMMNLSGAALAATTWWSVAAMAVRPAVWPA